MTEDLLAKEREFRRQNRELDQRTRDLMKEVDSVISATNEISNVKLTRSYFDLATKERGCRSLKNTETFDESDVKNAIKRNASSPHTFQQPQLLKTNDETQKENVGQLSSKKGNSIANKAIVSFLEGKVDILQNELQAIRLEYKKKCDYCKELEVEQKKSEDLRAKLQNQVDSLKDTVAKLENDNTNLETQKQAVNTENTALTKDLDGFKRQIKALNQQTNNYNVRLSRSLEDNEKLRNALKYSNIQEKELRNQVRKLEEEKRQAIKNLEKQRTELFQAFKKQALLVDNLKRQNAFLIANGRIQFVEEDFSRLLDQKSE